MMRNLKYAAAFAAAVLFAILPAGCTDDPVEPAEPTEPTGHNGEPFVHFDVKGVESTSDASRVIVGETTSTDCTNPFYPDYRLALNVVCSAPKKEEGTVTTYDRESRFAIGLFGDYTYVDNAGTKVTVNDFYRGDRLVYMDGSSATPTCWDTNTAMKYWHPGAKYIFRAYYPQRLYNYTVKTSNATTLALTYPSRKLQYDLLLAVNEVVATDNSYDENHNVVVGQMNKAVDLEFKHALAALRFRFKLNFNDADFLTSVYLCTDNDDNNFGPDEQTNFFSQGTVSFGAQIDENTDNSEAKIKQKRESIEWLKDYCPPATEILYRWVPPLKYWYSYEDRTGDGKITLGGTDLNKNGKIDIGPVKVLNENKQEVEVYETDEMSAEEMLTYWGWSKTNPASVPLEISKEIDRDGGWGVEGGTPGTSTVYGYNPVLMFSLGNLIAPGTGEDISTTSTQYHGKTAHAYYGTELYYYNGQWIRRAAGDPDDPTYKEVDLYAPGEAHEVAADGTSLYCRNGGWLLIPPQESFGALNLCFTTKKGGATLYKVKLPRNTKTVINDKNELIKNEETQQPITSDTDADGNVVGRYAWVAGYRYTYEVTISQSDYAINVSIQDWNERKHSTEIIF